MDLADQLALLEAAQGDPVKLALTTVDLTYPDLPPSERAALRTSLEVAAIPHWCDTEILAALLGVSLEESASRLARLRRLSVVEPFAARGAGAVNVHEATRLALRKRLAEEEKERFRDLSATAAAYFVLDRRPAGQIEQIYHLLTADPEGGADALAQIGPEWGSAGSPNDRMALALALRELEEGALVQGRAQVWVLLLIAWVQVSRGEAAQLEEVATRLLRLSRSAKNGPAEAESLMLLGDAYTAKGGLGAAQTSYLECLKINHRLAEQDPSNTGWQRELAVTYNRVGSVLEAQGKLAEAERAFAQCLTISLRLAEQDPSNAGWQRELAAAHSRVGAILEAQGKLPEAKRAFAQFLTLFLRLAEQDPSNAGWQRDLAVAHARVGGVLNAQGKLDKAERAFAQTLTLFLRLAEQDPSNAGWQRDLAMAHSRVGGVLEARGKLDEAERAFAQSLTISLRLAEQDPSNAGWQRDLAVAHSHVGGVLEAQGKLDEAERAFTQRLTISLRLAEQDPSNARWQRGLAVAHWRIAHAAARAERREAALSHYREACRIFGEVVEKAPGFAAWADDKAAVELEMASFLSRKQPPNG